MTSRGWTLLAVVIGSGIVFLDSTVVNVALRAIAEQLPASLVGSLEAQTYIVNGYLLSLASLLILAGALGDTYGRRRMFIIGLAGFGVTSMLCGLAPTMELLIAARLAQGAFGALLVPTSLAIITATFEGPERGAAFGTWAAATSALVLLGPPLGGFLVDTWGWRVAFLINVPLVAIGVAIAVAKVAESRNPDAPPRFDWLGAAAIAVAVGGLAYGAIRGQAQNWTDASAWAALVVGALATAVLWPLMTRRADPLVPPSLFASRNFTVTNISTLLVYGALYCLSAFQAIYLQGAIGYTAAASGFAGIPISIALVFFSRTFGHLAGIRGPRLFMAVGPALMALGLLWYVRFPSDSQPWLLDVGTASTFMPPASYFVDVLPGLVLFAVGIAMLVAPLTTALMSSVPTGNSGLASAINNAISRIGPLLATAVIFIAVSATFYGALADRLPRIDAAAPATRQAFPPLNAPSPTASAAERDAARHASTDAFRLAMLIAALLCGAGAAVNAAGIRNPDRGGPADEPVILAA
jgi:EmrB/QacA subfamily drug resistance transporter